MQAISSSQQSMMHRLLTQSGANTTPASSRSAIEDIANRLQKQQNGIPSYVDDGYSNGVNEISVGNNTPNMCLTCDDCGIVKNSTEEMEIHIKTEHLNWLPFQCPICLSTRASDAQMREHLHSSHKKTMNKFIYVDDMSSKRQLQLMMDRAINCSVSRKIGRAPTSSNTVTPDSGFLSLSNDERAEGITSTDLSESPPAEPSPGFTANVVKPKRSPKFESSGDTNTDALLASISRAAHGGENENIMDESLANMFFNGYKGLKMDLEDADEALDTENDDSMLENLVNPISVLDDVAALFSNGTGEGKTEEQFTANGEKKGGTKIVTNQVAKKRVLGECSKCNKPVTAGARQMHMFFHLAKDHKTYRFRCLFEGCNVEHYRKDQMENHQSKIHGKIDPDMMEDRSLELFTRCQELNHELFVANRSMITHHQSAQDLSMELLGTKNGSTPGPTAAKAELAYQQQNAQREKDKSSKDSVTRMIPDEEHPLECKLCHKTMQNRIRGFHILWHLAKDMGIMRYICKFCGFAHDRSQSVQTHGKKEHGADDVVLDKIKEYETEVNMMSEKCFGFQSSFAQDNKRRSKIPVIIPTSSSKIAKKRKLEDGSEDVPECESEEGKSGEETPTEDDDMDHEHEDEDEESKPARKRKSIRSARFGTRRPPSKTKRIEMLRLREISMLLGGAQYYKKKGNEAILCEKCGKMVASRLTEHAYTHIDEHLFTCRVCEYGHQTRDVVVKHMADRHSGADEKPMDNRLKFARNVKEAIHDCFSSIFIDAPIPTVADIEKLRNGTNVNIAGIDNNESDDHADDGDAEEEDEKDPEMEHDEEEQGQYDAE